MAEPITLTFTADEAAILIDALEVDLESYLESAGEARANGKRDDVATFTDAAKRITAVRDRVREALGEE